MNKNHTFKIQNTFNEIELLCAEINDIAQDNNFSEQLIFCLNVCLEEMLTNIVKYAYEDEVKHEIEVRLEIKNKIITLKIIDDGPEFNPLEYKMPNIHSDIRHREIGGIGIFLTCKMSNKMTYKRKHNKNIINISLSSEEKCK